MSVDTDLDYGPGRAFESLRITVRIDGPTGRSSRDEPLIVPVGPPGSGPTRVRMPASFGVSAGDDSADRRAWIQVEACGADHCVGTAGASTSVVTARALVAFQPQVARPVQLHLTRSCSYVTCSDPAQTCDPDTRVCVNTDPPVVPVTSGPTRLAAGGGTTCARMADGTVKCWGGGRAALSYLAFPGALPRPTVIAGLDDVIQVAVGEGHACALRRDHSVRCWGDNSHGQLGDGTTLQREQPVVVAGITDAEQIAAGPGYTCVVRQTHTVACWGRQLGRPASNGYDVDIATPSEIPDLADVVQIAAGADHRCVLQLGGAVLCWGRNDVNQLGDGRAGSRTTPTVVVGIVGAIEIAVGAYHGCARQRDGAVRCWGANSNGQRGDGTTDRSATASEVIGLRGASQIIAGRSHTCVRMPDGSPRCWGRNDMGQLGLRESTAADARIPRALPGTAALLDLQAGAEHTCALVREARSVVARCWGGDGVGQLASGRALTQSTPIAVATGELLSTDATGARVDLSIAAMDANAWQTCAQRAGRVACWGLSQLGAVGDPGAVHQDGMRRAASQPEPISGLPEPPAEIAASERNTCLRFEGGTVQCFGDNLTGALGDGTSTPRSGSTAVIGLVDAVQITAGVGFACALRRDRTVQCWGRGDVGQLGSETTGDCNGVRCNTRPQSVAALGDVAEIRAGAAHACARLRDGTVRCWGSNDRGQLGDVSGGSRVAPSLVPGLAGAVEITAGNAHNCARLADATLRCWGANDSGQLGSGIACAGLSCSAPVVVVQGLAGSAVVEVRAGGDHTCARTDTGSVLCWGINNFGQLGGPSSARCASSTECATQAQEVERLEPVEQLAPGLTSTCARMRSGQVICWGAGNNGELGVEPTDWRGLQVLSPVRIRVGAALEGAIELSAGSNHYCARVASAATGRVSVMCWGLNTDAQLGDGSAAIPRVPTAVPGLSDIESVSLGYVFGCAVRRDHTVWCWGVSSEGELGTAVPIDGERRTPVQVNGLEHVAVVGAGAGHACALIDDGTVSCWGRNGHGQLGQGTMSSPSPTPLRVPGLTGVVQLAVGAEHTCVRLADRTVRCWGGNLLGNIGDGTTGRSRASPTTVLESVGGPALTDIVSVNAGGLHNCAVTIAGAVFCWGSNLDGQLGTGDPGGSPIPVQVTALTGSQIVEVSGSHSTTCARSGAGELWCWGQNFQGTMLATPRLLPVRVPVHRLMDRLAASSFFTCARHDSADRGVSCWGANFAAQLGRGHSSASLLVEPVVGLRGVTSLAVTFWDNTACASVDDGSVLCWGGNRFGHLGIGAAGTGFFARDVLVTPPVEQLAVGAGHTCARLGDGTVRCWGAASLGELGADRTASASGAASVAGLASVGQVATGSGFSCAVMGGERTIGCWGRGDRGQLGARLVTQISGSVHNPVPTIIPGVAGAREVSAGGTHACAVTNDHGIRCWGSNEHGQLGFDSNEMCRQSSVCSVQDECMPVRCSTTARIVSGLASVDRVRAGGQHTCALMTDRTVQCWGRNGRGQLGDGSVTDRALPVAVRGLRDVIALGAGRDTRCTIPGISFPECGPSGDDHTCAVLGDGGVQCWGANARGQLGDGTREDRNAPVGVVGLPGPALDVSVGGAHSCARLRDDRMFCWGDDAYGQLGSGAVVVSVAAVQIAGL